MSQENGKAKLLLVEDDQNLSTVIRDYLVLSGYEVTLSENGESAWKQFNETQFQLCILDVMLPKLDGFSLAEQIRKKNELIPIIFLTAKTASEDKLKGFRIGADDYITKPFNIEELVLRIEVFLKRSQMSFSKKELVKLGTYSFDYPNLTLTFQDTQKKLTQREADILKMLSSNMDQIVKRQDILNTIWGENDYFLGRSLDVFISKLRQYLKDDAQITIQNYHSVGFKMTISKSVS